MIMSILKIQDFKEIWKNYQAICIIAIAVVAVLLLLFIIEAVRAHKQAKAFKNQLNENKKLSGELEGLKARQNSETVEAAEENEPVEEVESQETPEETVVEEESDEEPVDEVAEDDTNEDVLGEEASDLSEVEEGVEASEEAQDENEAEKAVEAEPVEETEVEETPEEEETAEEPVEEATEEPKEVAEENNNDEIQEATPTEEVVKSEPTKEEAPAELAQAEPVAVVEEKEGATTKTAKAPAKKITKAASTSTSDAKKTNNRSKGKYEIVQDATGFKYYLKASNGEILIVSESYTTLLGCKNAIKRLKENTLTATLRVEEDKNHNFQFHVVKGTRVVAHSANYTTKISAQNASKAFSKYVNTDVIKLQEESKNDLELVTLDEAQISTETVGKILVSKENDMFLYKLIANNGQTICMSATYKTMVTIQKSIESFKDAVYDGKFYIQKDKNDRYQFKLYNKASRLIMTGESFQTADSCRSNILSCYRFAKNAPIEYTDEALQK